MAIRYYDQALVEKIKNWIKDPNLIVLSPSDSTRLFQQRADALNDKKLTLPLVALSRDSDIEIISTTKKALSYDGAHLQNSIKTSKILNAIPIKLTYQLDIYTKYFAEADEYARNFIFNFINYPKLSIEIPYNNAKVVHDSTVLVESTISDSSDIPERLISGQFTRFTIRLTVDDAWLFSVPFMDNWKIETGLIEISNDNENIIKPVESDNESDLDVVEIDL